MKTPTKRVVSLVTAVSVMLGSVLMGANPAAADSEGGFEYDVVDGGAVITGCALTGCPTSLVIPTSLGTHTVTGIDGAAFQDESVQQVTFSTNSQITSIGVSAFSGNTLGSVALPPSLQSIGQQAFEEAGVTALSFGDNSQLQTIGPGAFHGNQVTSVTIPNKVTEIGQGAFYQNGLTGLTGLQFQAGSVLEDIDDAAFAENSLTQISIPDSVTRIGNNVFGSNNSLHTVNFTSSSALTELGSAAFHQNSLTSFVVPVNVVTVGAGAFMANPNLNNVRFLGNKPAFGPEMDPFTATGTAPIFFSLERTGWTNGTTMSGPRTLTGVPAPIITTQPASVTVTSGRSATLHVSADTTVLGQSDLSYQWLRGGAVVAGATTSSLTTSQVGSYQVRVFSWAGTTTSAVATVANPAPPAPPKPKPVVKRKQSVKVKLPSKLKRNRTYKLPAKTKQGRAIVWRVKGAGKCKINKKKHRITCKSTTGKKHFTLTGTAKAAPTLYAYKVTAKRKVR